MRWTTRRFRDPGLRLMAKVRCSRRSLDRRRSNNRRLSEPLNDVMSEITGLIYELTS